MGGKLQTALGAIGPWLARHRWAVVAHGLAAAATVLMFPPHSWWPLGWCFALSVLLWVGLARPSAREAFWWGLAGGSVAWGLLFGWLRYVVWPAPFLHGPAMALFWAAWVAGVAATMPWALTGGFRRRTGWLVGLIGLWFLLEYSRGTVLSGLPWLPLAASQSDQNAFLRQGLPEWLQDAQVFGWHLPWLLLFAQGWLVLVVLDVAARRWPWKTLAIPLFAVVGVVLFFPIRIEKLAPFQPIAVVHPGFSPHDDGDALAEWVELERQTRAATAAGAKLILWPEGASPTAVLNATDPDQTQRQWLEWLARDLNVSLIVGGASLLDTGEVDPATQRPRRVWFNGAYLFTPVEGLHPRFYAKQHLVPFGEYIPYAWMLPLPSWLQPIAGSSSAGNFSVVFDVPIEEAGRGFAKNRDGYLRVGVLICYEDVFPHLAARLVDEGAEVIVVLAENGWYGSEGMAEQHAVHSALIAARHGLSVVRAANLGISGTYSRSGRNETRPVAAGPGFHLFQVQTPSVLDGSGTGLLPWRSRAAEALLPFLGGACFAWVLVRARRRARRDAAATAPA